MFKKLIYALGVLLGGLLLLLGLVVAPTDMTPYQELESYDATLQQLKAFQPQDIVTMDSMQIGWGKASIVPHFPVELVGYGLNRYGKPTTQVHDSLYVRTLLLGQPHQQVAVLSFDLLFVSEELATALRQRVQRVFPAIQYLYFSATHTHHGFGGWSGGGLASQYLLGGLQENTIDFLAQQSIEALLAAHKQLQNGVIGYGEVAVPTLVNNRVAVTAYTDTQLRYFYCKNSKGQKALWVTYAAHNATMPVEVLAMSNDYVGVLLQQLQTKVDFAIYTAGMVGSHNLTCTRNSDAALAACTQILADSVWQHSQGTTLQPLKLLRFGNVPITLRSPQLRIAEGWKLRQWFFECLMGEMQPYVSYLQVNQSLLLGMPCDFSGELFDEIQQHNPTNMPLCITSFNGSYIGYVSADRHYQHISHEHQHYELRDMNWQMPQAGAYFTEIVKELVIK